ncbi:RNA polymerase sigma factor [Chelatococcus sp. GCM10030263]|uniref:RNA polymerase sigma factor n=1 Tax=Chelatococcus sp. GCM10030263 TaxID=3273387 RepID=UPI0036181FE7
MAPTIGHELVKLLPRLRRFALALCRSPSLADDLVQGACERALASAGSWTPGTRFDAWVFRILRNYWLDNLRRQKTEGLKGGVAGDDKIVGDVMGEDGEKSLLHKLTLADVRRAIDDLPTEQREVLVLVCLEDLAYKEAAEILGVPIGTVMSRLARARKTLVEATKAA